MSQKEGEKWQSVKKLRLPPALGQSRIKRYKNTGSRRPSSRTSPLGGSPVKHSTPFGSLEDSLQSPRVQGPYSHPLSSCEQRRGGMRCRVIFPLMESFIRNLFADVGKFGEFRLCVRKERARRLGTCRNVRGESRVSLSLYPPLRQCPISI